MQIDILQILSESALAYIFFVLFTLVGQGFLKLTKVQVPIDKYAHAFYCLIFGFLITITAYSVIITKGVTINIFIIPLLLLYVWNNRNTSRVERVFIPYLEIGFIIFLSVIILNVLPESEYKQNDSFFYLKITESLNKTGQENINHYYNVYNKSFHGIEPYHFFELWCNAFLIRITSFFYNSILVQRFVTYSIFIAGIIIALYSFINTLNLRLSVYRKIFCWSLMFFLPDLITFIPAFGKVFVSNFEGNFLERPNFRILYLFFIPLVSIFSFLGTKKTNSCFWLLIVSVISFQCAVIVLPIWLLYSTLAFFIFKNKKYKTPVFLGAIGIICLAAFYYCFRQRYLPSLYDTSLANFSVETLRHWKFILFSMCTSIIYIAIIASIYIVLIRYLSGTQFNVKQFVQQYQLFFFIIFGGIISARLLFLKDNAYQFLFLADIIITILIWIAAVLMLRTSRGTKWLLASVLFSSFCFARAIAFPETRVNIFKQNGIFVYVGMKYSAPYLDSVYFYFSQNHKVKGCYLADSNFYRNTYYSRRNPNVYFLPITYIVSGKINENIDICISDSASIMTGVELMVHKDYLRNAISRSLFYVYQKQHNTLSLSMQRWKFITDHDLKYLIITRNAIVDFIPPEAIKTTFTDYGTGEKFVVLR